LGKQKEQNLMVFCSNPTSDLAHTATGMAPNSIPV